VPTIPNSPMPFVPMGLTFLGFSPPQATPFQRQW
jgi:hypothetical protein